MFIVKEIITGGEFIVFPNWVWERKTGNKVGVLGFFPPVVDTEYGFNFAKKKLEELLKERQIQLCSPTFIDKHGEDILFCHVYLDETNIKTYFPEFGINQLKSNLK